MAVVYLVFAFTLNAFANILLKLGAKGGLNVSQDLYQIIVTNWQFLLGIVLFALNVIFYYLALRVLPLSVAYPIMVAMGFVIVNGYAFMVLNESVSFLQVTGYLLILVGLIFVVARM